ncbi:MAG TPA: hypothetical protein VKT28_16050 [Puia sp.]|nr:hypothetical protein [Puia sp.]
MKLFICIVSFLAVFTSCAQQKVKETFLIPIGFEGRIDVVFNQANAQPIPIEKGRRIYKIPADGILVTSSAIETGLLDQEYYYIDNSGNRTEIEIQDINSQDIPDKPKVVYSGTTGVYGNSSDKNPLNYIESIVASKKSNDSIYNQTNQAQFLKKIMTKTGRQF